MKADAIGLLMWIDTVIYGFVDYVYDIFNALAKVKLFEESSYQSIVRNIYAVLGIIMLFVLAYSLLKAVINPDEFAKGETSFPKLIKNVVISLAIIAVLPTVFTVAFNFQNAILNKDTIPKLIFGTGTDYNNENAGSEMAYYVFSAFLHPDFTWCEGRGYPVNDHKIGDHKSGDVNLSTCADNINADGDIGVTNGPTLKAVSEGVLAGGEKYSIFDFKYGESVADGKVTYNIFISTIAGVFLLYVLVNFCFDMAVRVVKLMFFQIIAPIPVICRVIPGGKLKDVFSDWMKKTISTYVDVFIRIATMYLGVFMISQVINNFSGINFGGLGLSQKMIAKALIIMGIVIFIRQAPKLISDMFHLDSGGMKLGLMDKLAMGGALTAGSVAGGAFGMLGRNAVSAVKGFNDAKGKGFRERAKALGFGAASIGAGTFSGAVRGFNRGKGAKSFADMKKASGGAVTAATAAKAKRDAYRANYKNTHPGEGAIQGLFGIGGSHILDAAAGAGEYFGIGNSLDALKKERDFIGQITAIDDNTDKVSLELLERDAFSGSDALMAAASHNTYNMSYASMKERMQQLRNTSFDSVRGRTLTDFKGNSFQISDENQFARFAANMSSQLSEAERKAKSYIKAQGYLGANGVSTLNALGITLGGGESQRMEKLFSDRTKIAEFVRDNQDFIAGLNSSVTDPNQRIDAISDGRVAGITGAWEQMDQLVTNAKNRNIAIDAEFAKMTREAAQRNGGSNSNK